MFHMKHFRSKKNPRYFFGDFFSKVLQKYHTRSNTGWATIINKQVPRITKQANKKKFSLLMNLESRG